MRTSVEYCAFFAVIECVNCFNFILFFNYAFHSLALTSVRTHPLSQYSPLFSSFPQHREKTKVSSSKHCTEGTKFLHKHGRPEVSFQSHPQYWSIHLTFWCVSSNIHLLSWFLICVPLNSTEIYLYPSPLCQNTQDICPFTGSVTTETHLWRVLILPVKQNYGRKRDS